MINVRRLFITQFSGRSSSSGHLPARRDQAVILCKRKIIFNQVGSLKIATVTSEPAFAFPTYAAYIALISIFWKVDFLHPPVHLYWWDHKYGSDCSSRSNKKAAEDQRLEERWRWGDSNPCPNIFAKSFLHAYFGIICREVAGAGQTNHLLSWIFLSNRHSLRLQHPVFVLSRRCSVVTGQPASTAQMTI